MIMKFLLMAFLVLPTMFGCVKRTISITTNPDGALVWVNDREMGRTPLEFEFTYYGEYDIRVELNSHEPIMTTAWTSQPVWDAPFVDFVADVAPLNLSSNTNWHFNLMPLNNNHEELLNRATTLRTRALGNHAK
jgi:hypothetical protein